MQSKKKEEVKEPPAPVLKKESGQKKRQVSKHTSSKCEDISPLKNAGNIMSGGDQLKSITLDREAIVSSREKAPTKLFTEAKEETIPKEKSSDEMSTRSSKRRSNPIEPQQP